MGNTVLNPVHLPSVTLPPSAVQAQFAPLLTALVELLRPPSAPSDSAKVRSALAAIDCSLETARAIEALLDCSPNGGLVTVQPASTPVPSSVPQTASALDGAGVSADSSSGTEQVAAPGAQPNTIPPCPSLATLLLALLQL